MNLGEHTVTRVRPPKRGPDGDPLPGSGSRLDIEGCSFQPRITTELTDGRDTVISQPVVFAPAGADVVATDQIEFRGVTYNIDGDPDFWDDLDGNPDHVEVPLRRVTG